MIRAKDAVVLVALAWWLLRDREETSVSLIQTCAYPNGETVNVPLGDACPGNSVLLTGETPPFVPPIGDPPWWSGELPYQKQMGGCGCGGNCGNCA